MLFRSAGTVALFVGLACSDLMTPLFAVAVLAGYLLVCAEVYLATHASGVFRMSNVGIGPTELRILLVAGTSYAAQHPVVSVPLVGAIRLFDLGGAVTVGGFAVVFAMSALRQTRELYRLEPMPGTARPPVSRSEAPSRIPA